MKKIVRLTESELTNLIKRIINEDSFTFGDKVRSKLGDVLFGIEPNSPREERLGLELYEKVKQGEYQEIDSMSGFRGKAFVISVNLNGEDCMVTIGKERITMTEKYIYSIKVKTPQGKIYTISGQGLVKKIMNFLK